MPDDYAVLDRYLTQGSHGPRMSVWELGPLAKLLEELIGEGPGLCAHIVARTVANIKTRKSSEEDVTGISARAEALITSIATLWTDVGADPPSLAAISMTTALLHKDPDIRAMAAVLCCSDSERQKGCAGGG